MKNFYKTHKNKLIYFLPALIVFMLMFSIFLIKGMYPFGNKIAFEMDTDSAYIPVLFKIHDIFHYGDSILWDFKIGGGANIYGSLVLNSIYSPLNWIVILVKRNGIVDFFNILLVIKFMLMSSTMFFFIRKNFKKVPTLWQIMLSIIYVFSGWSYLMYSNIFFIDTVILFPIIMHFFLKLIKENKCLGFILTLSYSLMLNITLTYMIYLFIIFSSFIALIFFQENSKKIIFNLSFSLTISLLIGSISYIPTIDQILVTSRFSEVIKNEYFEYFFSKVLHLIMSSILILNFIKYVFNDKVEKYKKKFYIIIFLVTTLGIIIEPINLAWHLGSYNSFPYRYSFISIFTLICISLEYFSLEQSFNLKNQKLKTTSIIVVIVFSIIFTLLFIIYSKKLVIKNMISFYVDLPTFIIFSLIFLMFMFMHYLIFKISISKLKKVFILIICFLEIFFYSYIRYEDFGYTSSKNLVEYEKRYKISDDTLKKYIIYFNTMPENSSYITRNSTISNWLHIIPKKQLNFFKKFGYLNYSTVMYDVGGTEFSNLILGVDYLYSLVELDNEIYDLIKEFDYNEKKIYIYKNKNEFSFGFLYENNFKNIFFSDVFDNQNYYFKKYFNENNNIINTFNLKLSEVKNLQYNYIKNNSNYNIFDVEDYLKENLNIYTLKKVNSDKIILYVNGNDNLISSGAKIIINDKYLSLSSNESIIYLGNYDSDIDIKVIMPKYMNNNLNEIEFGYITLEDYNNLLNRIQVKYNKFEFNKNKLHINIDSEKDQYLFLPINNVEGWKCKINGKTVKVEETMNNFMSIKLKKGNNDIKMSFYPPYLKEGIVISIFGIFSLVLFIIFKDKLYQVNIINKIIIFMYYLVSIILFLFIYVISNFIF